MLYYLPSSRLVACSFPGLSFPSSLFVPPYSPDVSILLVDFPVASCALRPTIPLCTFRFPFTRTLFARRCRPVRFCARFSPRSVRFRFRRAPFAPRYRIFWFVSRFVLLDHRADLHLSPVFLFSLLLLKSTLDALRTLLSNLAEYCSAR